MSQEQKSKQKESHKTGILCSRVYLFVTLHTTTHGETKAVREKKSTARNIFLIGKEVICLFFFPYYPFDANCSNIISFKVLCHSWWSLDYCYYLHLSLLDSDYFCGVFLSLAPEWYISNRSSVAWKTAEGAVAS